MVIIQEFSVRCRASRPLADGLMCHGWPATTHAFICSKHPFEYRDREYLISRHTRFVDQFQFNLARPRKIRLRIILAAVKNGHPPGPRSFFRFGPPMDEDWLIGHSLTDRQFHRYRFISVGAGAAEFRSKLNGASSERRSLPRRSQGLKSRTRTTAREP